MIIFKSRRERIAVLRKVAQPAVTSQPLPSNNSHDHPTPGTLSGSCRQATRQNLSKTRHRALVTQEYRRIFFHRFPPLTGLTSSSAGRVLHTSRVVCPTTDNDHQPLLLPAPTHLFELCQVRSCARLPLSAAGPSVLSPSLRAPPLRRAAPSRNTISG